MSKYDALTRRLAGHTGAEWAATFAELEALLGAPLPKTARTGKAWWKSDAATPQARAWAGWQVEAGKDAVVFRRPPGPAAEPASEPPEATAIVPADETPPILKRLDVSPGWGMALIAGGVAVVAGLGALAFRAVRRK